MQDELIKKLVKFSKEELAEALVLLTSDEEGLKSTIDALEFQAKSITDHLKSNSLVTNIGDKDDKTFDRAKMFLKELPELRTRILELKKHVIPSDQSLKRDANRNSVFNFIKDDEG